MKQLKEMFKKLSNTIKYPKGMDTLLIGHGQRMSMMHAQTKQIKDISEVEWRVFSQWGDDGIIDWLVSRIENVPQTFVEFGVENYRESNTRFLLQHRNWRGFIIDGSKEHIADIEQQDISWRHWLKAKCAFITAENINSLLKDAGFGEKVGLLSIDIDGNDYWIWEKIDHIDPIIVVVEYNAVFGDVHPISVPYDPQFVRSKAHYSYNFYGASLPAFKHLAEKKGYTFIGTNSHGVNAYFVKNSHANDLTKAIGEYNSYPSRFSDARDQSGELTRVRGVERIKVLHDMEVVNVTTGQKVKIGALDKVYSASWSE